MTKLCQLERSLDDLVRLEGGEDDVGEPEEEEDAGRDIFEQLVPSQLRPAAPVSEGWNEPSNEDECDRDDGADDVDRDGEGQGTGFDLERASLRKKIIVECVKQIKSTGLTFMAW